MGPESRLHADRTGVCTTQDTDFMEILRVLFLERQRRKVGNDRFVFEGCK